MAKKGEISHQVDNLIYEDTRTNERHSGKLVYPLLCSTRFSMAILILFGCFLFYCMRVNLAVAIVCMVNHTALHGMDFSSKDSIVNRSAGSTSDSYCVAGSNQTTVAQDGPFLWSRRLQGLILSCFYWGYVLTPVIGGWLAGRCGAKPVVLFSILSGSVLTMLMPIAAAQHYSLLMVLQISMGLCHGMYYSATHYFWVRWAATSERNRLIGFSYSGQNTGIVFSMLISGFLCVYGFAGGWPSIFYVMGLGGFVWCLAWVIFSASSPQEHRWISDKEREFIESATPGRIGDETFTTPWMKILSSSAVWAINVSHLSMNFGYSILLTNLPTYLKDNLKFNIQTSGSLSALPYIGYSVGMNVVGIVTDKLRSSHVMSVTAIRKLFNTMGLLIPACSFVGLSFVDCKSAWVAVLLLIIGVTGCSAITGGFLVNHGDIGPPVAGILFGISNTLATVSAMLGPLVAGFLTADGSMKGWHDTFYLAGGVMSFGALFYLVFGRGDIQEWAAANPSPLGHRVSLTHEDGEVTLSGE